jgi:hypothetical protein
MMAGRGRPAHDGSSQNILQLELPRIGTQFPGLLTNMYTLYTVEGMEMFTIGALPKRTAMTSAKKVIIKKRAMTVKENYSDTQNLEALSSEL